MRVQKLIDQPKAPESKPGTQPDSKGKPNPSLMSKLNLSRKGKLSLKPESKAEPPSDLTPQLVKRVHKLFEELGREDVRAVQDWEQAKHEILKDETRTTQLTWPKD